MAGKIFVTGDTHRKFNKLDATRFSQQRNLDKEDYVIICGDFGLVWDNVREEKEKSGLLAGNKESREETWWLNWLEQLPFTVLFVDGNHENFDRLYQYPVEEWHGGKVHKIRPSVIHLMRGQVFEIAGKKIFAFGGAESHDISDGILEVNDPDLKQKIKELNERQALYRINHVSWWKEEMPSEAEMEEGWRNLNEHGNKVDYIISHCCSGQIQELIDKHLNERNELTDYFDSIRLTCQYEKWYFGHYHLDKTITETEELLYDCIIEIGEEVSGLQPVLGKPRFGLYQPVKFTIQVSGTLEEKIGVVATLDAYGAFPDSDEPSYDIYAMSGEAVCLFKHCPESTVKALTGEEVKDNVELISHLAKQEVALKAQGKQIVETDMEKLLSGGSKKRRLMLRYWYIQEINDGESSYFTGMGIVTGHERIPDSTRVHTSEIKKIELDKEAGELILHTKNSVYYCPLIYCDFHQQEKASHLVPEFETIKEQYQGKLTCPAIEPGKVLLVLSNFNEYYFNSLYYRPEGEDGPLEYTRYPHIGTLQDSYLIKTDDYRINLCYFSRYQNVEFYVENTDGRPWFIENIGDITLYAKTSVGLLRLEPGDRKEVKKENQSVATGFCELDNLLSGGLQKQDLIVLAARPNMGKTTCGLNLAEYSAVHSKVPTVFFSIEMNKESLVNRLLAMSCDVPLRRILNGEMADPEWKAFLESAGNIGGSSLLMIDDTPGISISDVCFKCRKLKLEYGLGLVIIDYLQLMTSPGTKTRQQEISEISCSLKELAKELDVPIVVLSQLSRAVNQRSDKRPLLSDLPESDVIGQEADVVLFIYRDEYYNPDTEETGIAEIIIGKHHAGLTGTVKLKWRGEVPKFEGMEEES